MKHEPEYIGDGIYARDDGFALILTTGNHDESRADNVIVIEPREWRAIVAFVERRKEPSS